MFQLKIIMNPQQVYLKKETYAIHTVFPNVENSEKTFGGIWS